MTRILYFAIGYNVCQTHLDVIEPFLLDERADTVASKLEDNFLDQILLLEVDLKPIIYGGC